MAFAFVKNLLHSKKAKGLVSDVSQAGQSMFAGNSGASGGTSVPSFNFNPSSSGSSGSNGAQATPAFLDYNTGGQTNSNSITGILVPAAIGLAAGYLASKIF